MNNVSVKIPRITNEEINSARLLKRYGYKGDIRDLFNRIAKDLEAGNVKLSGKPTIKEDSIGEYLPKTNTIRISKSKEFEKEIPDTLIHEIQHAVDVKNLPIWPYMQENMLEEGVGEHHVGLPGTMYAEYLSEALPFIEKEEAGLWLGDLDNKKRAEVLKRYPWLYKIQKYSSNKIPTPWDLPNAPTLEKLVGDYVKYYSYGD